MRKSVAGVFLGLGLWSGLQAQTPHRIIDPGPEVIVLPEPSATVLPLAEDRGRTGLERSLKQLGTTASVLMVVAHPDDEDGALLTYLTRGLGARVTLLTLTRGEGGQNAMNAETYDALGLLRTSELLRADDYYGVSQLWGTEADFGFSKTVEESFTRWGRDRVLYDVVLAVRKVRPQIILASFSGALTDGHGQHQVSGEAAQLAFKLAADPNVFPEQLKNGLTPWQPLAVYSRTPFVNAKDGQIFDYATGKLASVEFKNYVSGEVTHTQPSTNASIHTGSYDPTLGRSYAQIAREGWGEQKSQYGGANPALSGPLESNYHLWAVAPAAAAQGNVLEKGLFRNEKVSIDTSIAGLIRLAGAQPPQDLAEQLRSLDEGIAKARAESATRSNVELAHQLVPLYKQALALHKRILADSKIPAQRSLVFELQQKIVNFDQLFANLFGLDVLAFRAQSDTPQDGPQRGSADETPRNVTPGEDFFVRVHTAHAEASAQLLNFQLESQSGSPWAVSEVAQKAQQSSVPTEVVEKTFRVRVSDDAQPTAPYFTRPSIEQPYYDIANEAWRERSFAPWPLTAQAVFSFDGALIPVPQVVQTLERVNGPGGVYQPLVVTPALGLRMEPEARVLPLDGTPLQVKVTVHAERAANGTLQLELPSGWTAEPAQVDFNFTKPGDSAPLVFTVRAKAAGAGAYTLAAVASSEGKSYRSGWRTVGYQGLQPYNQYKPATLRARKIDVQVRKGLRVGYVMGTGDLVPPALEELGATPHLLTTTELTSGDLAAYNTIVVGIRAYSNRPDLRLAQSRLEEWVRRGGTLVVQYQSENFPAPLPLTMKRYAERVVDESAPVQLLEPANPLLTTPNKITVADFDGWVEERGHSFLDTWDAGYTALTETADAGQDPQRGGLLIAHPGKGTYIYVAYALYRQLPELVPGSYRLLANLISAENTATKK
ncbi:PIG-L family deacetylase [Telmatobacter bradus]|uniref:PIG-L family deacetylase n=1 Tax=Telmatobacter bradus TaxID=474953 RepID=UPI003B43399A